MTEGRVIDGFSDYTVYEDGTVIGRRGVPLKGGLDTKGYKQVCFFDDDNIQRTKKVHRLVAEAFLPKVEGKTHVNHKDGNKLNNHIDNLEWCTNAENHAHKMKHGLNIGFPSGDDHPSAKLTSEQAREVFLAEGRYKDIAASYGIKPVTVCAIKKRRIRRKDTEVLV